MYYLFIISLFIKPADFCIYYPEETNQTEISNKLHLSKNWQLIDK